MYMIKYLVKINQSYICCKFIFIYRLQQEMTAYSNFPKLKHNLFELFILKQYKTTYVCQIVRCIQCYLLQQI